MSERPDRGRSRPAGQRLIRAGLILIGSFVLLYSAIIVAFGGWQADPLVVAWIRNLPEVLTGTWIAILFWLGLAALVAGLLDRWRHGRDRE